MDRNHHFTGNEKAEYDSLHHKGRSYYDDLRWHHFASHETAFDAAMKMFGHRISLLWEYYEPGMTEARAERLVQEVARILTDHVKIGKVITYVEVNPPKDELE